MAMLAEIFMVRLEAAARISHGRLVSSQSLFVPFSNNKFPSEKGAINAVDKTEDAGGDTDGPERPAGQGG
jgi:hypothetical protein